VPAPVSAVRRLWALVGLACAAVLSGCGGNQSPLAPKSGPSREIADLFWGMLAAAGVVFLGAVLLLVIAWRRRERGLPFVGEREGVANGLVIGFGIVVPVAALVTLFAVANVNVIRDTDAPQAATTRLTVEVIGRQWFWEVRYPGTAAVTANEIHIPARTRVNLVAETADVIHSFWVPELNRKIDMVPGKRNRILLYAEHPGRFRGQCAEFCGLQHANMSLYVFADPPARFRAWLAGLQQRAPAAAGAEARRGQQVFMTHACADCHTIAGTPARGGVGPDLSHIASRTTLAALTLPNRPDQLANWIRDPQHYKPGNKMPGIRLSPAELRAVVAYLETLR
jgi:cytochrome c oxidase subunit II